VGIFTKALACESILINACVCHHSLMFESMPSKGHSTVVPSNIPIL